ncbi:MAG: glycosyl transferase family 2 [Microbacterium sp. SCN 70-27]|uniref:glycosyltransferase family 2 protein n=1 Tax=unclassified Microbacterium TaxID=2609290 RepID=UPI0008685FA2|nr:MULTISPECIES: glycosyltransferase family 2 protein [unclassified Microbacterium]MBN9225391.1 glycosyltransferase family 2 protein [Microbacterium sp.]ODT29029.1 MAG: glycosyl transferase family 2 [Microbacterium sp. SCN 70-27]
MTDPVFSLVIPCYNEARSLPELIARARMVAQVGQGEVILVDNGSSDDTPAVMAELIGDDDRVRTVRVDVNQGYGFGITSGLAVARADIVGWTHADLQTDPADALRILPQFQSSDSLLFAKGKRYGRPLGDRIFTAGMSAFETVLLRTPLRDINAQPTLFHRSLLDSWDEPPTDFSLDLFAMVTARRAGFRVVRFPVLFAPRRFGSSSWNIDFAAKRRFIRRTIDYSLALRKEL